MSPDRIAEYALLEVSRAQREAWTRQDWLAHFYWKLIDARVPEEEAASIIEAMRSDEAMNLEMAA